MIEEQHQVVTPTENLILKDIGLRPFTPQEISRAYAEFNEAFRIGIAREGAPTMSDGGILAVKTGVSPISQERYQKVADGRVLSGSYGGTSWYTGIVSKDGQSTNVSIINNGATPQERVDTYQGFVERIGNHILKGADTNDISDITSVAASCGFEQANTQHPYGIEAQIPAQPSNWKIVDFDPSIPLDMQPFLGRDLLKYLHSQGAPQIEHVYFQNDTNAVVHDVIDEAEGDIVIPAGFVFGTGSNVALRDINTQASSYPLFPQDKVFSEMVAQGYVPNKLQMKLWMGGERIAYRVAGAMHYLTRDGHVKSETAQKLWEMISNNGKGIIVSRIVSGELSYDMLLQEGVPLSFHEYNLLKRSSDISLTQAGQAVGIMIATVAEQAGHTTGSIKVPVEGSVFWKAHGVKETALGTASALLPGLEIKPYEASGLRGVGKLALTETYERNQNHILFEK